MKEFAKKNAYMIISGCLLFCFAFFLVHSDAICMINWGKLFWDNALGGNVRDYSNYVKEIGYYEINYSIFITGLNAIWLAPVYFLEHGIGLAISEFAYIAWFKVLLILVVMLSCYVIYRLYILKGYERQAVILMVFLFLLSGTVLHGNIGDGQEDCLDNLFLLLALYFMQKKDYRIMSLAAGMMMVCKGRGMLFFFPLFLLLFGRELKNMVKYGVTMMIPYVISFFLSHVVFIDYAKNAAEMNAKWNNFGRLFTPMIGDMPIFLTVVGIICIVCWSRAIRGVVRDTDYILYPLIVFVAYIAFLDWTSYWLIYGMVFVLEVMLRMHSMDEAMMSYAGFNLGYYGYVLTHHAGADDNSLLYHGLLSYIFGRREIWKVYMGIVNERMPQLYAILPSAMTAVVSGFAAYILIAYVRDSRRETSMAYGEEQTYWSYIFGVAALMMPVIFLVSACMLYYR